MPRGLNLIMKRMNKLAAEVLGRGDVFVLS